VTLEFERADENKNACAAALEQKDMARKVVATDHIARVDAMEQKRSALQAAARPLARGAARELLPGT
jgi:hypothetical protein